MGRERRPRTRHDLGELGEGLSADDPINIQYTSGTTGFPKGATLSHHNILNNGYFVGELCHYTEQDRVCLPVPFYHCFGMVMGNLGVTSHGACIVIPAPGFDPAVFPRGVNIEFTTPGRPVEGADLHVHMRVYERGSAETLSCGSGVLAVGAVALRNAGLSSGVVAVDVPGGRLTVTLDGSSWWLAGPAVLVATGEVDPAALA